MSKLEEIKERVEIEDNSDEFTILCKWTEWRPRVEWLIAEADKAEGLERENQRLCQTLINEGELIIVSGVRAKELEAENEWLRKECDTWRDEKEGWRPAVTT